MQSSSGGGATALSEAIIRNGGIVFGACYSQDFKSAEFTRVDSVKELYKLKSSKYIETSKRIFENGEYKVLWTVVAETLAQGREVLFIGLGCDVAALKSFLRVKNINTDKLFTVDLICFGATSQEVHRQYVEALEKKFHSKIVNFTVRGKKKGWTPPYIMAEFENGKSFYAPFYDSDYGRTFGLYSRPSCYSCKFKGHNHQSDITCGDYWGLNKDMDGYNPNGVSVFIVRTQRGHDLLSKIDTDEFFLKATDVKFAVNHNTQYFNSRNKPQDHEKFFQDLQNVGLHRAITNHYGKIKYLLFPVKGCIAKFLPSSLKRALKKLLRRQ